jgi:Amt family ammonium transporter
MMLENRLSSAPSLSAKSSNHTETTASSHLPQIALWLANTLNCVADGLLATNACGEVLFMNSRAEQLTGWSVESAIRQSSSRVFHLIKSACGTRLESPLREAFVEEQIFRNDHCLLVGATGARTPIEFSAAPIRTEEGNVVGAVVVFREKEAAE